MSETAVERRLREMAERRRKVAVGRVEASWLPEYERLTSPSDRATVWETRRDAQ